MFYQTLRTRRAVTVSFSSGAGDDAWQWSFGDGGSHNGISATHSYSAAGNYIPVGSKGQLQIADVNGKLIKEYNLLQGKNKLDISLSQLEAGAYFTVFI